MFCIQDPSYENSMFLHESLLAECLDAISGAGAYAFATKDGVNLLLADENFKTFMESGTYTLVVGTDDITNEHAINALIELKKKYGSHLKVKAYVHNAKGSTFHPKFSWFKKADGGVLVLGSGNLTQKGLRHNREAYNVVCYDDQGISDIMAEWDRWYSHSEPFLFDIEDPIVMAKAKQNTEKIRAVSSAKASVARTPKSESGEIKLSDIYKNQPKNQSVVKKKPESITPTGEEDTKPEDSVPVVITDEDVDIDAAYWTITLDTSVLIAEIPNNNKRWSQANFSKGTFENYFGATCGENGTYRILLKHVNSDGSMCKTEARPSVSVASRNYRFELDAAKGLAYPTGRERPIGIFAKVSCRDFVYTLLMPGQPAYDDVMSFLAKSQAPSRLMRRISYTARDVLDAVPALPIWTRLEKDDNE